jgi:hypothetical protein
VQCTEPQRGSRETGRRRLWRDARAARPESDDRAAARGAAQTLGPPVCAMLMIGFSFRCVWEPVGPPDPIRELPQPARRWISAWYEIHSHRQRLLAVTHLEKTGTVVYLVGACPLGGPPLSGWLSIIRVTIRRRPYMKRIIHLLSMGIVAFVMSSCGYDPPASSNYQGSTNAPMSEEEQAKQPSVNQ